MQATATVTIPETASSPQMWRFYVLLRDNYTCQRCTLQDDIGKKLHAHHLSDDPELKLVVSNGGTLCISCHGLTHSERPRIKKRSRTYKKRYSINTVGRGGETSTIAIPPEVIDKRAEEAGMTFKDYIRSHQAVAHYNNFDGVFYTFEPKSQEN